MTLEYRFACPLPNGLHARPASALEAAARGFPAEITLTNERTGSVASVRSVLAMISADVQSGDPLLLRVSGEQPEEAFAGMRRFLDEEFAACDEALPAAAAPTERALPRSLEAAAPDPLFRGGVLCRGLAEGVIEKAEGLRLAEALKRELATRTEIVAADEQTLVDRAATSAHHQLEAEILAASGLTKDVLKAHVAILKDAAFTDRITECLAGGATTAAQAILATVEGFGAALRRSTSVYLQERALDLRDIGARLLSEIYGPAAVAAGPKLGRPAIVVAESLTPGQFLALDRENLRGLVLQHAGATSHAVILARSFGVPTLVGVENATALATGTPAILDANFGVLLPAPNEATRRFYELERRRIERVDARVRAFINSPGASHDGRRLPVLANVSSAAEVERAVAHGAEGVGLFRTEMLFLDRDAPPSEEEQTAAYSAALRAADGRPVTLRTFDIGGDKPAPYLNLPNEANPFLGYRGARLYERFSGLVRTQLRAMFCAAALGPLRIMAPMICCPEEMHRFRELVDQVRADFPDASVPVGMMIEVPSVAFAIPEFAACADFFSLGTNDLLQYFLAVDRENPQVAPLSSAFHPGFLRFLRRIVDESHALGRPVGLCGELGENSAALPLLLGLELDSISLGAPRIPAVKAALAALDSTACRAQLAEVSALGTRAGVEDALQRLSPLEGDRPLLTLDLLDLDSSSRTKHEVIKELADLLAGTDRAPNSAAVEEALWRREETYSTGFGHGFAIPHCQSDAVRTNSLALLRLRTPVEWDSLDGEPVRVILMLALRAENKGREHLRIFSRLSRLVMNDDFRARIESAPDAATLFSILETELALPHPTLQAA